MADYCEAQWLRVLNLDSPSHVAALELLISCCSTPSQHPSGLAGSSIVMAQFFVIGQSQDLVQKGFRLFFGTRPWIHQNELEQ